MNKLQRFLIFPRFIFLYLQLRYDLWRYERDLERGVHFDPSDFIASNEFILATQKHLGNKYNREISRNEAIDYICQFKNYIKVLAYAYKEINDE